MGLLTALALLPVAGAQSWSETGKQDYARPDITMAYTLQGCVRQLDTVILCTVRATSPDTYSSTGGNGHLGYSASDIEGAAPDGTPFSGNGGVSLGTDAGFQGGLNAYPFKGVSFPITYRITGYPRQATTFRALAIRGGEFRDVPIRTLTPMPFRMMPGVLGGKPARVYLESCVPASASTANCLASVVLATNVGVTRGPQTTMSGATLIRVSGVARQGDVVPTLSVSGATFSNVPVR